MSGLIDLELVKKHVRCDRDDEDDYLEVLTGAAISAFEDFAGRTLVSGDTQPEDLQSDQVPLYLSIQQGLLLLIGHWYENREFTSERPLSEIPAATFALWGPYKWYGLGDN